MSADALPFTLLIILAEFAIGVLWVLWPSYLRGTAASFVKLDASLTFSLTHTTFNSSGLRAMQSVTGLLYTAIALALSGEILFKGLLFATAVPT